MSNLAEELKDTLNAIERDVYDCVDFGGMFTEAYVLADELGESIASLEELVCDLWLQMLNAYDPKEVDDFAERMRALGLNPEGER